MQRRYNSLRLPTNRQSTVDAGIDKLISRDASNRDRELENEVYRSLLKKKENYSNPLRILEETQRGAEEGGLLGGIGGAAKGVGQFAASPWGKRLIALGISKEHPELAQYITGLSDLEEKREFKREERRKIRQQDLYEFKELERQRGEVTAYKGLQEQEGLRREQEKEQAKLTLERGKYVQKQETGLRKEFNALNKDFRKVRDAYNRIETVGGRRFEKQTAISDVSLIFNYMKMLDPGSVVRESEYKVVEKAGGVPDRIFVLYKKALSGQKLSPRMRLDILNISRKLYKTQKRTYDESGQQYSDIAKREGLNFRNIVREEKGRVVPRFKTVEIIMDED